MEKSILKGNYIKEEYALTSRISRPGALKFVMKEKVINTSKRGLTFSFQETNTLTVGSRYDYILEKDRIRIVASEGGKYKVSRKKRGNDWYPLIDLRNQKVLHTIQQMDSIRLHITDGEILVSSAGKKQQAVILAFPRVLLAHVRKVVGLSNDSVVSGIL